MPKFVKEYVKGGVKAKLTSIKFKTREECEKAIEKMRKDDTEKGIDAFYEIKG